MAALPFVIAGLAGLLAGRFAGARGWLVVPGVVVAAVVLSLVTVQYVDPLLFAISLAWAVIAAVGVLVGLGLRRRARPAV